MSKVKKCAGLESFQRMNYLYQICNTMATESMTSHKASIHYSNLLINVSKKAVQRLDVGLKRTICKGCRSLLLPGVTSKVRIKKKKIIHHCLTCSVRKVFNIKNRDYQLWCENPESVIEYLDYSIKQGKECKLTENSSKRNESEHS